ncbi:MAG: MerR family transcriptional regulator [Deltaproteobacteria bacterium]|nr:MerR family transcriptional regulator [Deltaproteobacteria bacterium]
MGIKIGELAKKSSIPASTIRYYVKQGILPKPVKVNKSMAYYDESCIEKLQIIRYLQETKYFPLTVIRNIIRRLEKGLTLDEAEAIEDVVFGDNSDVGKPPIDREEFLLRTGLSPDELDEAERIGLLRPYIHERETTLYNHEDIRFGRDILKRVIQLGGSFKDLEFYVDLGREIVRHEMSLRKKVVKGKPVKENIKITTELSATADFLRSYILKRLFQGEVQARINKSLGGKKVSRSV